MKKYKKYRTLGTKVAKDIKQRFKEAAQAKGLTPSALLRSLILEYLAATDDGGKVDDQSGSKKKNQQVYGAETSQHHEKTHNDDPSPLHKISLTDISSNRPSHDGYPPSECLQSYRPPLLPKLRKSTFEAYIGQPSNEDGNDRFSSLFLSPKGNYTSRIGEPNKPGTSARFPLSILLLLAGFLYFLAK